MRILFSLLLLTLSLSGFAQVGQRLPNKQLAYYGAEFYTGNITKASLAMIINGLHMSKNGKHDTIGSSCNSDCYKHTSVGYDGARQNLFGRIYLQQDGQGNYVKDVYCGKNFYFKQLSDVGNMHTLVNIEHTWPQSKFSSKYEKGIQKSDMHHLFLTDSKANSERGNFEFGNLDGVANELRVENCEISKLGHIQGGDVFQPPVAHRGNVARALFYFATHYEMSISKTQEDTLRKWHEADPVDAAEAGRHEMIATIQTSRNPFVDYPELVKRISDF